MKKIVQGQSYSANEVLGLLRANSASHNVAAAILACAGLIIGAVCKDAVLACVDSSLNMLKKQCEKISKNRV